MRKLLVASQKSGVGKTTTSINLAAATAMAGARVLLVEADPINGISSALHLADHPSKKPLKDCGIELPGVLFCGVVPGLDVFSPYEEGGCTDEDLDRVLQFLALDAFRDSYDCLVVNAPPFLGGRPSELLASCDEYVVVMQAEPLAHRTMPAFVEMVQRAGQGASRPPAMRGILLTLPESETPGGRWDRELRGRFGSRVLAHTVPYDEEVGKATLFGHVLVHASPEAPAARVYHDLAAELKLARDASGAKARPADAMLTMAAAAVRAKPLVARAAPKPATAAGRRSSGRLPRLHVPGPAVGMPRQDPPAPPQTNPAAVQPAPEPPEAVPAPEWKRVASPPMHTAQKPWLIWVGLAAAAGIGLRFVRLPSFALPVIVGLAVTAAVTLVLHLLLGQQSKQPAPAAAPATPPADNLPVEKKAAAVTGKGRRRKA